MINFLHQDAQQSSNRKADNKSFENMSEFRCLGTTETNKNYIREDTKIKLKFWKFLLLLRSETFISPYSMQKP
jgi:hypothetical protein